MAQSGWVLPRLALGASWSPMVFDGTGILSLCYGDTDVSPPLTWLKFRPNIVPSYDVRQVASLNAPRAFARTGYGAKLRFDIEIAYDTNQLPGAGRGFLGSTSGADLSLDSLASIMARSAGGLVGSPGTPWPPYLFLTTTFQTGSEQWIPCEVDVDGSVPEQPYAIKTFVRSTAFSLSSRQTFQRIMTAYTSRTAAGFPSGTASIPAPSGGGPVFSTTITLFAPLDSAMNTSDQLLLLFNTYSYYLFTITAISAGRTSISAFTIGNAWPGAAAGLTYRTMKIDPVWQMPYWLFDTFAGVGPTSGYTFLPSFAKIIGQGQV
jgi:hypothetical protein